MKSVLFAMCMLSFIVYRAAEFKVDLEGTWKGHYKTIDKTVDVKIIFRPNNRIELYSNALKNAVKATGSYTINNSNEILITCKRLDEGHVFFIMNGKLNPKKNFLDGDWKSDDHSYGSFYFEKTVLK